MAKRTEGEKPTTGTAVNPKTHRPCPAAVKWRGDGVVLNIYNKWKK
jgi:hypothetical protein